MTTLRPSWRRLPRWTGVALAFLLLCCADEPSLTDAEVVARVGDDEITVGQVRQHLRGLPADVRDRAEPANVVQALVDERLILDESERLGLDRSAPYRQLVQRETRRLSLAELYRRQGIVDVDPTEAQLESLFAASPYSKRVRFSLMMVKERADILPLMEQLRAGADFEELSMAHSQDHRILMRQADMGYHRWGETMPSHEELTRTAFQMEPGQIAGPLAVADGHFLLKVTDVHPVPLSQERETMERLWRQRQLAGRLATYCDTLSDLYEVSFHPEGMATLWTAVQEGAAPAGAGDRSVVSLTGGGLTVDASLRMVTGEAGSPATPADMQRRLERSLCREVLMLQEIGRLDLVNSDEVKEGLAEAQRRSMLRLVRQRIEERVGPPSMSHVQLHYEDHLDDYVEPPQVTVRRLSVASEEAGRQVVEQLRAGVDTAAILDRFVRVTYPQTDADGPLSAALAAAPGSLHGPLAEEGGFVVLQILQRREARTPDLTEVQETVVRDLVARERADVFEQYLAELRAQRTGDVVIFAEVLERLGHG